MTFGTYFLKRPGGKGGRKSFSIVERKEGKNKALYPPELAAINHRYLTGKLSLEQATQECNEVIDQLLPHSAILHHQDNLKILEEYWNEVYADRDLVDKKSAKNRLTRAIEACGGYSLLSASKQELQQQVESMAKGNRQRDVVAALNQIFVYLKSKTRLRKNREIIGEVSHITYPELQQILPFIKDDKIRLMHEVAFATGARAGEIFGLLPEHIQDFKVRIRTQIDTDRNRRQTKNRRERVAYIVQKLRAKVIQWACLPLEERLAFRKRSLSKITREASRKALGRAITFHALRHSYAIYLISKGDGLTTISRYLGDSLRVTERYYAGYISTPEEISRSAHLDS